MDKELGYTNEEEEELEEDRFTLLMCEIDYLTQAQATELISTLCHLHADLIVRGASKILMFLLGRNKLCPVPVMRTDHLPAPVATYYEEGEGFSNAIIDAEINHHEKEE